LLQPFIWRSDSQRYAKISIPIIWVVSILLSLPMLIYPTVSQTTLDGLDILTCTEILPDENVGNIYWIAMFALLFVIPLILIFILHVIMVVVIAKEKNSINQKQNRKMIKMTIAVVTVFLICTGMQHTYFLVMVYGNVSDIRFGAFFFCASNFVVSVQAALNPIIYGTFRQDFNKGFRGLICKLMKLLKLLNNSPYLCHDINYHEYHIYEEDTFEHVTDFDHYFRSRKSCLADQIDGNVTGSRLYSLVEEKVEENDTYMLENNNEENTGSKAENSNEEDTASMLENSCEVNTGSKAENNNEKIMGSIQENSNEENTGSKLENSNEENTGSMLENSDGMLNQIERIDLEQNKAEDIEISSSSFYLLSKEFLNRLSHYMEESKETKV